jgi:hypothetical protein
VRPHADNNKLLEVIRKYLPEPATAPTDGKEW